MEDISKYIGEKNWKYTELSEQSGREARKYYLWFKEQIKKRIEYLREYLVENKAEFKLDYSEESLSYLWIWYRGCNDFARSKVNENKKVAEELFETIKAIEMDIAIYFAETMIHNHPQLYWDYLKKGPRMYSYHQPVVMGFAKDSDFDMLPWRIIQTSASVEEHYGRDDNILKAYKVWERHIEPIDEI